MRSVYTAMLAATALLVPAVTRADPVPTGYLTGLTRSWALDGCATGPIGFDPAAYRYINGPAFCVTGFATLGRAANGFDLWIDLRATPAAALAAYGTTYSPTLLEYSGARFQYGVGCLPYGCFGSDQLYPRSFGTATGLGILGFSNYALLPSFDFARFELLSVAYTQRARIPGEAYPGEILTTADLTITSTPEPATLALTLGGLAVLAVGAWRRRTA